jgi:endoglucanase
MPMRGAATAYMVRPDIVGLRFETGEITAAARTVPYEALPGDRTGGDRVILRDGEPFGIATATPDGAPMVQTFDAFVPSPASDFFFGRRPDLLGARLSFLDGEPAADRPESFTLVDLGTGAAIDVDTVWRKSKIVDTARTGLQENQLVVQHDVFLELERPLEAGSSYRVAVAHEALSPTTFSYDSALLPSEAVHVSQIGFRPDDPVKVGYLSMWLGHDPESGRTAAVDYAPGTPFRLLDVATGAAVFAGAAGLDEPVHELSNLKINYNLADVLALDFSDFTGPGRYVVEVEGIGTSLPFAIGDDVWVDAFATAMQGFYHQRSGIALDAALTDWPRPRALHPEDGVAVYQSNATLMDTDQGLNLLGRKSFEALAAERTDQLVAEAWGGWHDAGDWDRRIQHMQAARDLLELAELRPAFAATTPLAVPEQGNGIPDLIDEALWAVDFYQRLQKPDGGVPGGIEGDAYPPRGETSWTPSQDLFVYAPDAWSSYLYAGVAARAALLVEPYAAERAAGYAESAVRAMRWAEANTPDYAAERVEVVHARNLAAAELFRLTGDEIWHDVFEDTSAYAGWGEVKHDAHQFAATMVYARTDGPIDQSIL